MMLFLIGVQFALAFYARHVLTAAAQDAAADAARFGAPPGTAVATATVDLAGTRRLITAVNVTPTAAPNQVTVTVSGRVESVLSFLEPTETVTASAPIERFVPEVSR